MKRVLALLLTLAMLVSVLPAYSVAADAQSNIYRWTVCDDRLVSDGMTANTPTMLTGSIKNGVMTSARFSLEKPVVLRHNCSWVIEWCSKGNWDGMLLSSALESPSDGLTYLFRYAGTHFLAFGERTGTWDNYGMIVNIDMADSHIFRLENRISSDGTNTVYLLVDGQEMGAMTQYYKGGTNQNSSINWANGKDLVFSYIGTSSHPMSKMQLEYLQIIENQKGHSYTPTVMMPSGTQPGYTVYTCALCGDSYRTAWLDTSAYQGKTIACVGDSITAAYGVTKDETDYVTLLAQQLGMQYIRLGASGTTLCTDGSRTCNIGQMTLERLNGADVVTIAMGINDFCGAGAGYYQLGSVDSTDTSTIYGAVKMWCQRIEELRKTDSLSHTQFYFVTPLITSWNNSVTSGRNWDQAKTNIHGYTLRDLCNAIIEVAAFYDIPVIDQNILSGLYYVDAQDNNTAVFGGDGVHPGNDGHRMMAAALANVLLQNNLRDDHTHTYGSWITTTWPSPCQGEQQRVCSVCCATESRSVEQHSYTNGVCAACGDIVEGSIWTVMENGAVTGAFADLQSAVDACQNGGTVCLTENCAVTSGVTVEKDIVIDGGNHLADISACSEAFITVSQDAEVTIRDLRMDGGADGFQVDYAAVTYTNYTIPLVPGSLNNDPKAKQSAVISIGNLICENVDISNRYTASVGGAMQILAGTAQLTDCDFFHNYGTSKGGALYIGSNLGTRTEYPVEKVTIESCTFTHNYTGHGGAIYGYNLAQMTVESSAFVGNTANGGKGGAIDLFSETTQPTAAMALGLDFIQTTIRDCRFENNWAGNDGFAIQSYDSDLYIFDSEFIGNVGVHPTSSVGTISTEAYRHADTSWRIYTLLEGCLFEENQGPCAVYGDHSSISDLDVRDCVFRNNAGNDSFLLYAATSNITNCRFEGETMATAVIDARIYENYEILPLLTLTDVSFADCQTPAEILTRKQNHNESLDTYKVVLQGTTNGDIAIWNNNSVSVLGSHTGNVELDYGTERSSLTVDGEASVNGIIYIQPSDIEVTADQPFSVAVNAEGNGLSYQWYYKDATMEDFSVSGNLSTSYACTMQSNMHGRQVYCVITDLHGNSVTTHTATITQDVIPTLDHYGDINSDSGIDHNDAIYLLLHTMFGQERYPLNTAPADIDGNGIIDQDDAVYLLLHALFGEAFYPLNK